MKKTLVAMALAASALDAPACGPYFDYTYIVAASPRRAFQLPELSMLHELGKIKPVSEVASARSILPDGVELRELCYLRNRYDEKQQWYDTRVDPTTTAELTDLYTAALEFGSDQASATALCRRYFAIRAGFDGRLHDYGLRPVILTLEATLTTLAELPREFYLYLDGARAFHQEEYGEAAKAFNAVLALPPEERRYRSTWALFMIGRMAVMAQRHPEIATAHPELAIDPLPIFALVRTYAAEGFIDTHNLAAGTFHQEALLAANACDTVRELHALARYNLVGDQYNSSMALKRASIALAETDQIPADVLTDRLSRSVLVAFAASHVDARPKQAERILTDLNAFTLELTPYESGRLAWIAYALGRVDDAEVLVDLAPDDPYALWTQSRLQLRSGNLKGAVTTLNKATRLFPHEETWDRFDEEDYGDVYRPVDGIHNEQAVLQLARNRYVDALELFLIGESWLDAAYVAEHVLTLDELLVFYRTCQAEQRYAETIPGRRNYTAYTETPVPQASSRSYDDAPPSPSLLDRLRVLVGRRMLREKHYTGAPELFPESWRHLAVAYVHHRRAISTAQDNKTRAFHQMQSAHLLRHWGMELTGYEGDPDFTYVEGQFYYQETSTIRANSGTWRRFAASAVAQPDYVSTQGKQWEQNFDETWMNTLPEYISLVQPTPEERRRLKQHELDRYHRWHYRFVAAEIFKQAEGLLPDQTEEKAQALFYGAQVLKKVAHNTDAAKQIGDLHRAFFKKCGSLEIVQKAKNTGWFPTEPDVWKEAFNAEAINGAALALASDKLATAE